MIVGALGAVVPNGSCLESGGVAFPGEKRWRLEGDTRIPYSPCPGWRNILAISSFSTRLR
ncbi:hypothetical protein J2129_001916 [Methanofollis sp. W23]|nr:hypothetical protein [Methanofollis sp. W23]